MSLEQDFREIRRTSTPIICVQTQDFRESIKLLSSVKVNGEADFPVAVWTCSDGPSSIRGNCPTLDADYPYLVLKNAQSSLRPGSVLFFVIPDTFGEPQNTFSNQFTVQAMANLRDDFKSTQRTLVLLSIDGKLPPLLADDVPILKEEKPSVEELTKVATKVYDDTRKARLEAGKPMLEIMPKYLQKAASLGRGLNTFAFENAFARCLSKEGIDYKRLSQEQIATIESSTNGALKFYRGEETFDDIGGLEQIKKFFRRLIKDDMTIFILEEWEKQMAGANVGTGDTSGVSQDQSGVMLNEMENNGYVGSVFVGAPGGGKSLLAKSIGNTFGIKAFNIDMGACKGQYVGNSEASVRKMFATIKGIAGSKAFFIATSNGLNYIAPELKRRFRYGTWYFDLLSREEKESVWKINLTKYNLPLGAKRPDDTDFVGADIRNICDLASKERLNCSLLEATEYIVPVAKSDPGAIQRLRDSAHNKFLSAASPGVYEKPEQKEREPKGRNVSFGD